MYSYYSVFKDEMSTKLKVFNYTILAVGLGGCILGIYGSIAELVNPEWNFFLWFNIIIYFISIYFF